MFRSATHNAQAIAVSRFISAREARSFAKPHRNSLVDAMSLQTVTLESLSQAARKTNEAPPRVSVYDVIAIARNCDGKVAEQTFRRMFEAGTVPVGF